METIHLIVETLLWAICLAAGAYGFGFFFEIGRIKAVSTETRKKGVEFINNNKESAVKVVDGRITLERVEDWGNPYVPILEKQLNAKTKKKR